MVLSRLIARARRRLDRTAGRFARADDGATAIEFALVAMTFENAVIDIGRQIRTGQVQTSGGTAATFKTAVCNKMNWLGSKCSANLSIDVRTFSDYATSNSSASTIPTSMSWSPGTPGSIVLIRAYYTWPLITPLLQTGLQSASGNRVIYAATAFTNEPYE